MDELNVVSIRFQRNGISGIPFHTLQLEGEFDGPRRFIATVMEGEYSEDADGNEVWGCNGQCAIQEIDAEGNLVDSGWRGDRFEGALRSVIDAHTDAWPGELHLPVTIRWVDGAWVFNSEVAA